MTTSVPRWRRILLWPVTPSRELKEVDRRNAHLVLGLELIVIVALVANILVAPPNFGIHMALAGVLISYLVTKVYSHTVGIVIVLGVMSLGVLVFFDLSRPLTFEYISLVLIWSALPVVLASMFYSARGTALVAVLNLGMIIAAGLIIPGISVGMALGAAAFTITVSPLLIVAVNHRNQLERIRQAELQAANDALRRSEAELEARVRQRTAELAEALAQAEIARKQAEQADKVKSQFLASMSHELRTPLNAILNFTEMMSLGMVGDVNEQQKDILGKSLISGRHLLDLINDVLDVSKMQSGMLALFIEDGVDLKNELETVVNTAQSLIKDKPVKLVRDIDIQLPPMSGDRRRIRQILLNLVSNAAKFTEEGSITISAHQDNGQVVFGVVDTGPGIALENQERIFMPFVQTEKGIQHAEGTGLGLAISRHLAEAHGGKLWVESKPGQGAAFFVSLPAGDVPAPAAAEEERR